MNRSLVCLVVVVLTMMASVRADSGSSCSAGEIYDSAPYTGVYSLDASCLGSAGVWVMKFSPKSIPWNYSSICVLMAISNTTESAPTHLDLNVTVAIFRVDSNSNEQQQPVTAAPLYTQPGLIHLSKYGPSWTPADNWQTIPLNYVLYEPQIFIGVYWQTCAAVVFIETTTSTVSTHPSYSRDTLSSGEWMDMSFFTGSLAIRASGSSFTPSHNQTIPNWNCSRDQYNDGHICNCNCGPLEDPDCALVSPLSPNCTASQVCYSGVCVTPGWNTSLPNCPLSAFGYDKICNCGCGGQLMDPDCYDQSLPTTCGGFLEICSVALNKCMKTWTCDPLKYNDTHHCDCECGSAHDPDCSIPSLPSTCSTGMKCSTSDDVCVPNQWHCEGSWFNSSDGCDCNCGVYDPDCDDSKQNIYECDSGLFCSYSSSCIQGGCGNNHVEAVLDEECDSGVGCDLSSCHCQTGFYPLSPARQGCSSVCGDGIWANGTAEECDGNDSHCFTNNCTCFVGYHPLNGHCGACGNSVLDVNEECDGGDGCLPMTCKCDEDHTPFTLLQLGCKKITGEGISLSVVIVALILGGLVVVMVAAVATWALIKKKQCMTSGELPLSQLELVEDIPDTSVVDPDLDQTINTTRMGLISK